MREVVTKNWCDVCFAKDDSRVEATYLGTVAIDGDAREIELCDEHQAPLAEFRLIAGYGRVVREPPAVPRRTRMRAPRVEETPDRCPVCLVQPRDRTAFLAHFRHRHGGPYGTWLETQAPA